MGLDVQYLWTVSQTAFPVVAVAAVAVVVVAAVVGQPLPVPTDAGVSGEEIDHAEK